MTYRNGIVADVLRRGGLTCYDIIFGLNIPQIKEIAGHLRASRPEVELRSLADALWADKRVRCSRLLAIHLYNLLEGTSSYPSAEEIVAMHSSAQSREESQFLALRLPR